MFAVETFRVLSPSLHFSLFRDNQRWNGFVLCLGHVYLQYGQVIWLFLVIFPIGWGLSCVKRFLQSVSDYAFRLFLLPEVSFYLFEIYSNVIASCVLWHLLTSLQLLLDLLSYSSASYSAFARYPILGNKEVMLSLGNFISEQLNLTKDSVSEIKVMNACIDSIFVIIPQSEFIVRMFPLGDLFQNFDLCMNLFVIWFFEIRYIF